MSSQPLLKAIEYLKTRDLIQDTSEGIALEKVKEGDAFYVGFDPTATSLHLGNLLGIIVSIHLAKFGLKPLMLFGGATGQIGDPSGKSAERPLLTIETIKNNVALQSEQVRKIFARANINSVSFVNNADWTQDVTLLDFLRDIGKHFTVNYMLGKDSVQTRLNSAGISYTEFTYMILQSFDFLHLYQNHNCKLQIGGSDQWGNITAGLELIRKKISGEACAFCTPLITNSEGKKFGKSEGGAIWLDPTLTSPYQLYQFLLNTSDIDAVRYLKIFTFLDLTEINLITTEHNKVPEKRIAQKKLAFLLCELIHGSEEAKDAEKSSEALFSGSLPLDNPSELKKIFSEAPCKTISILEKENINTYAELFTIAGLCKSKGEARRLISGGGAYVNEERVLENSADTSAKNILDKSLIVLRSGKKNYVLIEFI